MIPGEKQAHLEQSYGARFPFSRSLGLRNSVAPVGQALLGGKSQYTQSILVSHLRAHAQTCSVTPRVIPFQNTHSGVEIVDPGAVDLDAFAATIRD